MNIISLLKLFNLRDSFFQITIPHFQKGEFEMNCKTIEPLCPWGKIQ